MADQEERPTISASATPPAMQISAGTAGGSSPAFGMVGSGLHLAHTVRVMKVYGVTDGDLSTLEQTHWSAAGLFGAATFALGFAVNIVTSAGFQEKFTPASWVFMLVIIPMCLLAAGLCTYFAHRYEKSRESQIDRIKSQSVYIDPNNAKVMELFVQIQELTAGKPTIGTH